MYRWSPGPVLGGKIKMVRDPNGDFVLFDELPREQRRYEIAKDVMAALVASGLGHSPTVIAPMAVEHADALLAALEESSDAS